MKPRTGHLFKRGDTLYVSWKMSGKPFMRVLRDENGRAITPRREAEEARDKFMAPLAKASEAEVLQAISAKIEARK